MSSSTLYFYKLPINLLNKNFVLENIETYLATLTPVTKTDFQYQRAELEKTIKVNMSQSYQLNLNGLTKYNYLKVVMDTAVYYYIIRSAKQVSESTIEFNIVMDVLNTFTFSQTASNKTYTLSNKSLITREHKDRLVKLPTQYVTREMTTEELFAFNELKDHNQYQNTSDENVILCFNTDGIKAFMNSYSITDLEIQYLCEYGAYIQYGDNKYTNVTKITINFGLHNYLYIRSGLTILATIDISNLVEHLYLVIPPDGGVISDFDYAYDWTLYMNMAFFKESSQYIEEDKYKRVIDYYQEGLSTILFKKEETTLFDEDDNNQWYVVYSSANAVTNTTDTIIVNPVKVRFYSDRGYSISTTTSTEITLYATSSLIPKWTNTAETLSYYQANPSTLGDVYVKVSGTTYDFYDYQRIELKRTNNNDLVFSKVTLVKRDLTTITYTNVESVTFFGINNLRVERDYGVEQSNYFIHINSGYSTYSGICDKWEDLDLTDPKFIKAFAFPYCPCDFMVGKDSFTVLPNGFSFTTDDFIQLDNTQKYNFNYQKKFRVASPISNININIAEIGYEMARNIKYESKLYHSDYYQPKFVYDSFSFMFALERININAVNQYYKNLSREFFCTYIVSRNVQSKFAFMFDEYSVNKGIMDYENILTIERNNEKALYNNSYLNYVKSGGYSYDQKKASSQNAVNGVTTALSIVGAVASFAGGVASHNPMLITAGVGLTVSTASSIIRTVHSAQEQDRAISQKINQNVMQGTSVQGSEDIDILTAFSGNKAKLVYYELSDRMKQAMWDLFHYCGYATHEQKIPAVNTRIYFNYVQGEIVLQDYTFNDVIALSIIQKWRDGVTFMHLVNSSYDFNQEYENFETSLI